MEGESSHFDIRSFIFVRVSTRNKPYYSLLFTDKLKIQY